VKTPKKKYILTSFLFPSMPPPLFRLPFSSSSPRLSAAPSSSSGSSSSKPHGLPNVSVSANSPHRVAGRGLYPRRTRSSSGPGLRPPRHEEFGGQSHLGARELWRERRIQQLVQDVGDLEFRALFGLWYLLVLFNIYFNIYKKQVKFLMDFAI
jgi:hypothetical protein